MKTQTYLKYLPSLAFITIFFFIILSNLIFDFSNKQNLTSMISLILVSSIGVYHGAFDIKKGSRISKKLNTKLSIFSFVYVLFSLTIILLWFTVPTFLLSLFLLISILHFGSEDYQYFKSKSNYLAYFSKGVLIIILPLIFHFNDTVSIFKTLNLFTDETPFLFLNSNYLILILLTMINFIFSLVSVPNFRNKIFINIDMLLIILLNFFFDPIFAFAIYFCFLHSLRNIFKTEQHELISYRIFLTSFITFVSLITVFSFLYVYFNIVESLSYTIFIGLASLTFPHIATDIIYNNLNLDNK